MADKLIPTEFTQNNSFCRLQLVKRLDTQLNEPTIKSSMKVHKVVKPRNKETLLCNFED